MARNKHIREEHVEAIANVIHTWDSDKLTWDQVCDAAQPILGYRPSRSGLSSHRKLLLAYQARKKNLRFQPAEKMPHPGSLASAARMLEARESEINALKQQITEYRNKFDRWRYNALLLNITIDKLDKPLPPIDRRD